MDNRQRIMASKLYREGEEFSVAKMTSQIDGKKQSVSSWLQTLSSEGVLDKLSLSAGRTAYRRKAPSKTILCKAWVSAPTPTDDSPRYC